MSFVPLPTEFSNESIEININDLDIPKNFQEYHPLLVGIVLDISLRHHADSRRHIDIIKAELTKAISPLEERDDRVYLYHPDNNEIPSHQGEAISRIADYRTPLLVEAEAIKKTLEMIGMEDHHLRKKFIFITDRNSGQKESAMRLALSQNKTKDYRCELYLIGIGNGYNPILENLPLEYHHIDDPYQLSNKVTEVLHKWH